MRTNWRTFEKLRTLPGERRLRLALVVSFGFAVTVFPSSAPIAAENPTEIAWLTSWEKPDKETLNATYGRYRAADEPVKVSTKGLNCPSQFRLQEFSAAEVPRFRYRLVLVGACGFKKRAKVGPGFKRAEERARANDSGKWNSTRPISGHGNAKHVYVLIDHGNESLTYQRFDFDGTTKSWIITDANCDGKRPPLRINIMKPNTFESATESALDDFKDHQCPAPDHLAMIGSFAGRILNSVLVLLLLVGGLATWWNFRKSRKLQRKRDLLESSHVSIVLYGERSVGKTELERAIINPHEAVPGGATRKTVETTRHDRSLHFQIAPHGDVAIGLTVVDPPGTAENRASSDDASRRGERDRAKSFPGKNELQFWVRVYSTQPRKTNNTSYGPEEVDNELLRNFHALPQNTRQSVFACGMINLWEPVQKSDWLAFRQNNFVPNRPKWDNEKRTILENGKGMTDRAEETATVLKQADTHHRDVMFITVGNVKSRELDGLMELIESKTKTWLESRQRD